MQHKYYFEAVHRMLMDVRSNDALFGGVPTIFGGDFAQILPVVPRGSRADIVGACLQRSFLWPSLRVLSLRLNMRVHSGDRNRRFIEWVRSLAHDTAQAGSITILPGIDQYRTTDHFYDHIYPPALLTRAHVDQDTFRDRAILTVRNDTVAETNDYILNRLTAPATDYYSVDTVEADLDSSQDPPPAELLQTFNPPSLPPLKLRLKVGAPMILLRNLYPKEGLCNGTRMVVTSIGRRCIKARILGGSFDG